MITIKCKRRNIKHKVMRDGITIAGRGGNKGMIKRYKLLVAR